MLEGGGDSLLTVKNNQAALRAAIEQKVTAPRADFPLVQPAPTQARTCQENKGRTENRAISTAQVQPEAVGFPLAEQAARILRQTSGRQEEAGAMITSAPPERLNAVQWLKLNRAGWGDRKQIAPASGYLLQ